MINGTVVGGSLSPNANSVPGIGRVVVDTGGGTWLPWAQGSANVGCDMGIVVQPPGAPGTPMQVQVAGQVPYNLFNLGGGNPTYVVAGATPGRGSSGGQCIGTCDASGTITMWPSYVGVPSQMGAAMVGLLGGQAMNTQMPTVGQALVWDGAQWTAKTATPGVYTAPVDIVAPALPATTTLSPAQYAAATIYVTGTIATDVWTVAFPNVRQFWLVDFSQATFSSGTLKMIAAGGTLYQSFTAKGVVWVYTDGNEGIWATAFTAGSAP